MIDVIDLRKTFDNGFEALKGVNLKINHGDLVCLLGPSGCGKSTILNLIAGLLDPTGGDILFHGKSVVDKHPGDRRIGMVFQSYALYPHMTVMENVLFPLRVGKRKKTQEEALRIAKEYMELTSITELAEKKPGQMSGGQQQRVAITRALVQNPEVLLLDEPLSNLDARLRLKIREEIRRLVKRIGMTTIFVTHDQEEALSISDKIALMDEGVIQQYAGPQELYLDPVNLFAAKFIGNPVINTFEVKKEDGQLRGDGFSIALDRLEEDRICGDLDQGEFILGVRPEHFVLKEDGPLKVEVELVEMIGRYCIIHFELGERKTQAVLDSRMTIKVGDRLNFDFDYSSFFLFDKSGKRVY